MSWTTSDATALADALDRGAADKAEAADSADVFVADPANSPWDRSVAREAAHILRTQARDMRADAAAIRDGADPTELGYTA
ncbi:hypothetical protein ACFU7Y_10650 [Kitasatospora sp. NPDC057542]|uniref:hypothetical protein n=1 Tax=Kitasatospora sp. NPDC057542 TaxID=3346162 RepID=UPI00369852CA